ncbi:MAG: hypothetical protein RJA59_703 [Pseudomonadota bacterium]
MIPIALGATLGLLLGAPASRTPYEALVAARVCKPSRELPEARDCEFDLGTVHFLVLWTGTRSPQVNLVRADPDSPYRIAFLPRIGCVQVGLAKVDPTAPVTAKEIVAFVSTATAGVHSTFLECEAAQGRAR